MTLRANGFSSEKGSSMSDQQTSPDPASPEIATLQNLADYMAGAPAQIDTNSPLYRDAIAALRRAADALASTEQARQQAEASLAERIAAKDRAFAAFGHGAQRGSEGECICPYCTGNAELLVEMTAEYELQKEWEIQKREAAQQRLTEMAQEHERLRALLRESPHDMACHPSEGVHTERCQRVRAALAPQGGQA